MATQDHMHELKRLIDEGEQYTGAISYTPHSADGAKKPVYVYSIGGGSDAYDSWKLRAERFIMRNFEDDLPEFRLYARKEIHPRYHGKMLDILRMIAQMPPLTLPELETRRKADAPVVIPPSANDRHMYSPPAESRAHYVPESIHRAVATASVVSTFAEALSDELTGKQMKELRALIEANLHSPNLKSLLIERLNSYGDDFALTVVINTLSNPDTRL